MNDGTDHRLQDPNSASAFYCNMEALSPADRVRHQSVTQQLLLSVKEMKEFQTAWHCALAPMINLSGWSQSL
jgi:hypothetical protein